MITRTVSELAELCDATLEGDGALVIVGPATLAEAASDQVSFLGNPRYAAEVEETKAACVLVAGDFACERDDLTLLRCENPSRAFSRVIEAFRPADPDAEPGVHESAIVGEGCELPEDVCIGAGCVLGRGVVLGPGVRLHPGVVLGSNVRVGEGTELHPNVVAYAGVEIGKRCILHAGCVIGSDGFGFDPTPEGWDKIPQVGTVIIEDDVEMGANCAVDRGRFGPTRICRGVKFDNLVHVAHNVEVGEASLLVAQVGIAGSAKLGKRVIMAGQSGASGHVTIGDGARVGGAAAVGKDLEGGKDYLGVPARDRIEVLRSTAAAARVPDMIKRLRALEARLAELEEKSN